MAFNPAEVSKVTEMSEVTEVTVEEVGSPSTDGTKENVLSPASLDKGKATEVPEPEAKVQGVVSPSLVVPTTSGELPVL